jgi:hypothetical protein
MKTTDFIVENQIVDSAESMHKDHEVQMARQDCYNAAEAEIELHHLLKTITEIDGLDGWVSEKITLAADYLKTVRDYLQYEHDAGQDQTMPAVSFESIENKFNSIVENTSSSSIAVAVTPLGGGKPSNGVPKKLGNVLRRPKVPTGKGVY